MGGFICRWLFLKVCVCWLVGRQAWMPLSSYLSRAPHTPISCDDSQDDNSTHTHPKNKNRTSNGTSSPRPAASPGRCSRPLPRKPHKPSHNTTNNQKKKKAREAPNPGGTTTASRPSCATPRRSFSTPPPPSRPRYISVFSFVYSISCLQGRKVADHGHTALGPVHVRPAPLL